MLVILAGKSVRTRVCLTFDNWKIVVIANKPEDNITFYISARSKDIPRSVLVILACNPVRTRVCITLGNWKIVVMSKKFQHNMTCHINASHIMLLPYIYTLYINYLACVYLIYEYELRLGKHCQGLKKFSMFHTTAQNTLTWRMSWKSHKGQNLSVSDQVQDPPRRSATTLWWPKSQDHA